MRRLRNAAASPKLALLGGGLLIGLLLWFNWSTFSKYAAARSQLPASAALSSPPIEFHLISKQTLVQTSGAHCSLSTMNPDRDWESSQCSLKNICYHQGDLVFFQQRREVTPPVRVALSPGQAYLPRIFPNTPLPLPRYLPSSSSSVTVVWILIANAHASSSTRNSLENFLRDGLFAWWLLGQHAVWQQQDGEDKPVVFRPMALNGEELSEVEQMWYDLVFPQTRLLVARRDLDSLPGASTTPVCFPRSVVGLGVMTDHCLANEDHRYHEQTKVQMHVKVESVPCSTGRAPLFHQLKTDMITNSGLSPSDDMAAMAEEKLHVLLAPEFAHLENLLPSTYNARVLVPTLDPKKLIRIFHRVAVFVTRSSGDDTLGAMFQPPGSAILLVQAREEETHFVNFAYWNNLAYIRAIWHSSKQGDDARLVARIGRELAKSLELIKSS